MATTQPATGADAAPSTDSNQPTDAPAPSSPPAAPQDPPPAEQPPNAPPASSSPPNAPPETPRPPPAEPVVQNKPVPFIPTDTGEMYRYAQWIAKSELIPKQLRNKPHDVLVVLLKGQSLGLHPQTSIAGINVIEGKAEIGAQLMVALCLKSGLCEYFRLKHSDLTRAVYETKRIGSEPVEFEYTIEEAEMMGLLDKGRTEWAKENNQWKKQPRTMLRRRCQSNLAREVFPDVVGGVYDFDELTEQIERERARAVGVDPDRVIPMDTLTGPPRVDQQTADDIATAPPAAQPSTVVVDATATERPALPEPPQRTIPLELTPQPAREPVPRRDPLKERLKQRAQDPNAEVTCKRCQGPTTAGEVDKRGYCPPCVAELG